MKKLICLTLLLCLLTACSQKPAQEENLNMINPMVEVTSLKDINDTLGLEMNSLLEKEVSNESYFVINNEIGEYNFDLSGFYYTLRGSSILDLDISGLYFGGNPAFTDFEKGIDYNTDHRIKVIRFVINEHQYTLSVNDENQLTVDEFMMIASEVIEAMGENYTIINPYNE